MSNKALTRVLGAEEAMFTELARRTCGGTLVISFVKVLTPLSVEQLKSGFASIHKIYPLLQARVETGEQLRWRCDVPFESIPFEVRKLDGPLDFEREFTRRGETGLNVEKCTYTLSFYINSQEKVYWVSLVSSHAALDGRSVMTLFCILDIYFKDPGTFKLGGQPLYDAVESYFDSPKNFVNQEQSPVKDSLFKWPVEKPAFATEREGHAIYRQFPMEDLSYLVKLGKGYKVRPSALFCAVAIQASQILPNHRDWIKILLPMDVRDLCGSQIGLSAVGVFSAVTTLEIMPDIDTDNTWQLARYLQIELDRQAEAGESCKFAFPKNYDLGDIIGWSQEYENKSPLFSEGLCVSNVGSMKALGTQMQFFEIVTAIPFQTHGAHPISLLTYSTVRNSVFLFSYCDPLTKRDNVLNFAEKFINTLKKLLNDRI
ncbi:hypothetical protein MO867_08400 [Microbulbifer sp. OS29]|uniref:Condensation domain-containing protein n=1 Tax=Microbulbifer okhotskensis TaxID=2926617 RepID=A0A9X2EMF1_9GAMM|nr:hypothetical protein [Microbulbifer okhotskensis]MCO1334359.1 hypothetical protein [Microbulbifer okhotskensis]